MKEKEIEHLRNTKIHLKELRDRYIFKDIMLKLGAKWDDMQSTGVNTAFLGICIY